MRWSSKLLPSLLVLALPLGAPLPAAAQQAQDPEAGVVVLPPRYGEQPVAVQKLRTSPAAVLYRRNEGAGPITLVLRRLGGARQELPEVVSADAQVSGDQVAVQVPVPDRATGSRTQVLDLSTGTSTFSAPYPSRGARGTAIDYFVAATGDGWVDVRGTGGGGQGLVRSFTDGRPPVLLTSVTRILGEGVADREGLLYPEFLDGPGRDRLLYLDFATGAVTQLWSYTDPGAGAVGSLSLSPAAIGWVDSARGLFKVRRSAPSATPAVRREAATAALAVVTDAASVWITSGGDPDRPAAQVVSALDGAPAVGGPQAAGDSIGLGAIDGGDVAVIAGQTARTRGVYRFTPGATTLGPLLDEAGTAPPLSVEASAGRLAYTYPGARSGEQGLFDQGIDREDGALDERGTERRLATITGESDVTSGRTAHLVPQRSGPVAVVQDGGVTTARIALEPDSYDVAVSGHRLVTATFADVGFNPVPGTTYVRDLRDPGAPPRVFPGVESTALTGSDLVFLARDGSIRVRDLDADGVDVAVRPRGFPEGAETDGRQTRMTLLAAGDFVYWSFPSATSLDDPPVETRVARVSRREEPSVLDIDPDEVRLADGVLAYVDRDDREVHLLDLADGSDRVVGTARRPAGNRAFLALDPDFVAYVAPDDTTRVVPTRVQAAAPPTVLGGTPTTAFSPDGDGSGELFGLGLDASRPVESYDVTVTGPSGQVVRQFGGTAPDGGLRARWDGRDATGRPVPDGTYTWSVTGTGGPERGALRADGQQAPLAGRVAVDRVDPARATTSAPPRASDGSAKPAVRVSWGGSETGLRFDVDVTRRIRTSSGALAWAPAKRWITGTRALSAAYTGTPYAVQGGEELRFTATAVDAAGNRRTSSTSPVVVVPYDERSSLLRFSSGWTTASASDRWGGSSRVSGTAGRRVALTASGTRYEVIGDRCPACGRFTLLVDGTRRGTVDTYSASSRKRQVLASVVLPRGSHRVELVVVGVRGRTVRVDAVALTR